jgi:hypothetical protein
MGARRERWQTFLTNESAPAMRFWDASSNGLFPEDRSVPALRRGIPSQ